MTGKPKRRAPSVTTLHARQKDVQPVTPCLGTIASWSEAGGILVDYAGNAQGPLAALSLVSLSVDEIEAHVSNRTPVLLTFDRGQLDRPVIIGVVQPAPTMPVVDDDTEPRASPKLRALVDGEEVVVEGKERVELRCGKASIVLTKAGKVLIQGTYISSRSSGAHRIRGGSVEVN